VRLRWLLNALEEQTLSREQFEVVVVHDDEGDATEDLLRTHPLAATGVLRHVRLPAGTGSPGRQRNTGWRAARANLIAFTDDDCRPAPEWLACLLAAAAAAPGAIVQGRTKPDPFEREVLLAPRARTIDVDPPGPFAQACNILYPRASIERAGGFDERMYSGEDTDLALRARRDGAPYVPAPDALVYHAIESYSLRARARVAWKWRDLPKVVKRHPQAREHAVMRFFWKREHVTLPLAAAGAALAVAGREPAAAALALPYLRHAVLVHGRRPGRVARATAELPSSTLIYAVEIGALVAGSIRHRTVLI
jgi:GT2 family glycosyltransferase